MNSGLARRLTLALALLLLGFGAFVAMLVRQVGVQQDDVSAQRLAHGLARHIVANWPQVHAGPPDPHAAAGEHHSADRQAVLQMLMTVNPGIRVYLLQADGRVQHYLGQPGMVRTPQVDLAPVSAFLAGHALPLRGTDPMGGPPRPFSVAPFPPRAGQPGPPGLLYIVLQSPGEAAPAGLQPVWQGLAVAVGVGLLATVLLGALLVRRLTVPLHRLSRRMQAFDIGQAPAERAAEAHAPTHDEVQALAAAFDALAARVDEQVQARETQARAHREVMANVAHDMRTPLTALHGHLEALAAPGAVAAGPQRQALLSAALSQSEKVRRLTQQLFELATLQSTDDLPQREQFRLDELVSDTVQKFHPGLPHPPVLLVAPSPGPIVLDGDLHLIERALSNLIDNAVRHAGGPEPVQVSLVCEGPQVEVRVSDRGPGLPPELARRLDAGQPVREPPERRPGGGIGGLGLAIAQRIAVLHGGSLRTLPLAGPGTLLALALPLVRPAGPPGA